MTIFQHVVNPQLQEISDSITEVTMDGKRHYAMNGLAYPSVTTILGSLKKPEQLEKWIDRVGTVEAERIKNNSAERGSHLHKNIEAYLLNHWNETVIWQPCNDVGAPNQAWNMFIDLMPYLNRINNIHCLEQKLYSSKLKTAGRVDCIAEYDGILSVIDFKNARNYRTGDMIENYFLQATAYAGLYETMTNIRIDRIVILIAVENKEPQVYIRDPKLFVKPLVKVIKDYYDLEKMKHDQRKKDWSMGI